MTAYPNIVFDLDGVVYLDQTEIPGAGDTLRALADRNILFATNNASQTKEAFAERIERITGYPAHPDQIVSSAMAAASLLEPQCEVLAVAGEGVRRAVVERGCRLVDSWQESDAVIVGFDVTMTYERLRDGAMAIRNGARFIAANADATFPTPEGLWPGAGASVGFLTTATGQEPDAIAGKPHEPIQRLIGSLLVEGPVLMVGDRPETDLATGQRAGWDTALVLTGVTNHPDEVPADIRPTHVIESISDLLSITEG